MIKRLRRYLEKKKLILSAEKSKMMVFEKNKRKENGSKRRMEEKG